MRAPRPRPLDPEEFAEAFGAASRSLWTLAAGWLGDPAEAEDAVQEAALLAYQRRGQFERGTNFAAWLATFVRNVVQNTGRKRSRRATTPVDPGQLAPLEDLRGVRVDLPIDARGRLLDDVADFDDRLLAALRELAPVARACLLLRVVLEHSYAEIAEILGVPEGTAMSHVHRARAALRERLEHPDSVTAEGMQR
jgi:RNA polymerase sigma-70 factor (ECF subfamily)